MRGFKSAHVAIGISRCWHSIILAFYLGWLMRRLAPQEEIELVLKLQAPSKHHLRERGVICINVRCRGERLLQRCFHSTLPTFAITIVAAVSV